jgi:two-component system NarL family sensor kinase
VDSSERRRYERRSAERDRMILADRLITAEQEERRRLALELHDGPVQNLAGIALMLDAVQAAIGDGRLDDATRVLGNALEHHRNTIRSLRDLSFSLEPVVLRDQGLGPAVEALADQLGTTHGVAFSVTLEGADELAERAQVALYQILREAMNQAVDRGSTQVTVSLTRSEDGGAEASVDDDGAGERRRASVEVLRERARILEGDVKLSSRRQGGMSVHVRLPPEAVQR